LTFRPLPLVHLEIPAMNVIPLLFGVSLLGQSPARPDSLTEVRALLAAQQTAWNEGNLELFLSGYWDSPELVFQSGGTVTRGFAPTRERYHKRYKAEGKAMGRLTFSQLEFEPLGEHAALARGRWALEMPDGQKPGGLFTLVIRKMPEGWRIIHDHTSSDDRP